MNKLDTLSMYGTANQRTREDFNHIHFFKDPNVFSCCRPFLRFVIMYTHVFVTIYVPSEANSPFESPREMKQYIFLIYNQDQ